MAAPSRQDSSGWGAYEQSQQTNPFQTAAQSSQWRSQEQAPRIGRDNNHHSTAVPSAAAPTAAPPQRRKAKNHRRRHVPVGPAGVWFQAQHQHIQGSNSSNAAVSWPNNRQEDGQSEADQEIAESGIEFTQGLLNTSSTKVAPAGVAFYSPAWISMQCDLSFVTPSLPACLSESDRYTACRPHVPGKYMMIHEILAGQSDWKLPPDRRLLVLVHTIQSLADNLWVAELTDETGTKMSSWIQPRLVQQEQQRQVPQYIRPGLVWMLRDTTLLLVERDMDNDSMEERHDRMLLVGDQNIEQVWTPASGEEGISDRDYIRWMEKRNALTSSVNEDTDIQENGLLAEYDTTVVRGEDRRGASQDTSLSHRERGPSQAVDRSSLEDTCSLHPCQRPPGGVPRTATVQGEDHRGVSQGTTSFQQRQSGASHFSMQEKSIRHFQRSTGDAASPMASRGQTAQTTTANRERSTRERVDHQLALQRFSASGRDEEQQGPSPSVTAMTGRIGPLQNQPEALSVASTSKGTTPVAPAPSPRAINGQETLRKTTPSSSLVAPGPSTVPNDDHNSGQSRRTNAFQQFAASSQASLSPMSPSTAGQFGGALRLSSLEETPQPSQQNAETAETSSLTVARAEDAPLNSPSPMNAPGKENSQSKRSSSKKKRKAKSVSRHRTSPKRSAPSNNLWSSNLSNDALFDDGGLDEDDDSNSFIVPTSTENAAAAMSSADPTADKALSDQEDTEVCASAATAPQTDSIVSSSTRPASLFQTSSFAAMAGLLDDDDDDDL